MRRLLFQSVAMVMLMTILTGIAYPLIVTGIAQGLFPRAANGSLIVRGDKPIGSELIGQAFTDPKYFWSRPSATAPFADNSLASSGSNLAPSNPALSDAVRQRVAALRAADPGNTAAVPVDLVTASGSGLDPQISPAAAAYQIDRVARVRALPRSQVALAVAKSTQPRQLGILGESRVNVLELNLLLDNK